MKKRNFVTMVVICAIALIACLSVTAFADGFSVGSTAYVCADTAVHLREEPQGTIIGSIRRGETVTILSKIDRNGYYHVRVNKSGEEGYAYGEYLTLSSVEKTSSSKSSSTAVKQNNASTLIPVSQIANANLEDAQLVVISNGRLNLRMDASKTSRRIKWLHKGEKIAVISSEVINNYVKVVDSTGTPGYVDIDFVAFDGIIQLVEDVFLDDEYVTISSNGKVNLRSGAGTKYSKIKWLHNGDLLTLRSYDIVNNYILVEDPTDGTVGYVSVDFISYEDECPCQDW